MLGLLVDEVDDVEELGIDAGDEVGIPVEDLLDCVRQAEASNRLKRVISRTSMVADSLNVTLITVILYLRFIFLRGLFKSI